MGIVAIVLSVVGLYMQWHGTAVDEVQNILLVAIVCAILSHMSFRIK